MCVKVDQNLIYPHKNPFNAILFTYTSKYKALRKILSLSHSFFLFLFALYPPSYFGAAALLVP